MRKLFYLLIALLLSEATIAQTKVTADFASDVTGAYEVSEILPSGYISHSIQGTFYACPLSFRWIDDKSILLVGSSEPPFEIPKNRLKFQKLLQQQYSSKNCRMPYTAIYIWTIGKSLKRYNAITEPTDGYCYDADRKFIKMESGLYEIRNGREVYYGWKGPLFQHKYYEYKRPTAEEVKLLSPDSLERAHDMYTKNNFSCEMQRRTFKFKHGFYADGMSNLWALRDGDGYLAWDENNPHVIPEPFAFLLDMSGKVTAKIDSKYMRQSYFYPIYSRPGQFYLFWQHAVGSPSYDADYKQRAEWNSGKCLEVLKFTPPATTKTACLPPPTFLSGPSEEIRFYPIREEFVAIARDTPRLMRPDLGASGIYLLKDGKYDLVKRTWVGMRYDGRMPDHIDVPPSGCWIGVPTGAAKESEWYRAYGGMRAEVIDLCSKK
jgi:hypothetical protein